AKIMGPILGSTRRGISLRLARVVPKGIDNSTGDLNVDNAKWTSRVGLAVLAMGASLLVSGTAAGEDVNMYDGEWRAGITPYLWLPSLHGELNIPLPGGGSTSADVQVNPSSYL